MKAIPMMAAPMCHRSRTVTSGQQAAADDGAAMMKMNSCVTPDRPAWISGASN